MNLSEFNATLSSMFYVVDGPPYTFFELPLDIFHPDRETPLLRIVYVTWTFKCEKTGETAVNELCSLVLEELRKLTPWPELLEDSHLILFYRRRPFIEGDGHHTTFGMRFAVPGLLLTPYPRTGVEGACPEREKKTNVNR